MIEEKSRQGPFNENQDHRIYHSGVQDKLTENLCEYQRVVRDDQSQGETPRTDQFIIGESRHPQM